jgi:ABC-type uncharacterized transport system ATPase subunit
VPHRSKNDGLLGGFALGQAKQWVVKRANALLAVCELCVRFGGIVALHGVSFNLMPRQLLGLIGPNGGGKTTLIA